MKVVLAANKHQILKGLRCMSVVQPPVLDRPATGERNHDTINIGGQCLSSLSPSSTAEDDQPTIDLGGRTFPYIRSWTGQRFTGDTIAIDTETELIDGVKVPQLALASASSGEMHALMHPDRIGQFLLVHRDCSFVAHNAAFDYWVLAHHLEASGEREAMACLS